MTMATEPDGNLLLSLPQDCIAEIMLFIGPKDTCKLSTVCSSFRDVFELDSFWERFLPKDYESIISQSSDPFLLNRFSSKKQLFMSLCHNPILIEDGRKSFSLDKWSGKKCHMISVRDLSICWSETSIVWRLISLPDSRFSQVAELIFPRCSVICADVNSSMLSPSCLYASYLVFKANEDSYRFECQQPDACIGKYPKERGDGWQEIEIVSFYNKNGEDGEFVICAVEPFNRFWTRPLIIQGIEIRPKNSC